MWCLLLGAAGFLFCCLFDINKIRWNVRFLNLFFVLGSFMLIFSTIACIFKGDFSVVCSDFGLYRFLMLLGLILSVIAEIYALFFALPFNDTYMESEKVSVVNRGWYRACRHPGFWSLAFVYLFLWLFFSNIWLFYAFIVYTACNYIYIVIQDIYIFPKYIHGYDDYKKTVPFLLPTKDSICHAFLNDF